MKKMIFTAVLALLCYFKILAQDKFLGFWSDENKTQIIKIYKINKLYYGDLIYKKEKPLKEMRDKNVICQMKKKNKKVLHRGTYFDYDLDKKFEVQLVLKRLYNDNFFWI